MNDLSGVLVIDKPEGMTSHTAVKRVRYLFRGVKVGHLGTLDPMATGVLPMCLGKATRIGQFLDGSPKEYSGQLRLGLATTTYDRMGTPVGDEKVFSGTIEDIRTAVKRFTGDIEQTPPTFSAKKIGGVPSYKFARSGRPIGTPAVTVKVESFEIAAFEAGLITFRVVCSPGTYVRALAHDLGELLECGAHLTSLRRTRSGRFTEAEAVDPDAAVAANVIPLDRLLEQWVRVEIEDHDEKRVVHGNLIPGPAGSRQFARILNKRGEFLAIGLLENGWVHPRVVLTSNTSKFTSG